MMVISKAAREEYESVRNFYHSMIDALEGTKYHPKWQKDIYPAPEDLRASIEHGELYTGRVDGRIAAAMVLNGQCNPEYEDIVWTKSISRGEFMVIHMLGVHNDFAGRGLAKEMVKYAIETARDAGMKAIRLDVLKGNVPAEKLYPAMGFVYVDTIKLFYEDTGRVDFELFELVL